MAGYEAIDNVLAEFIAALGPESEPLVEASVRQLSLNLRSGHTCLDLAAELTPEQIAALAASPILQLERGPLVLAGTRLYLRRFFAAEQDLARRLSARASRSHEVDEAWLHERLARFKASGFDEVQLEAARVSLTRSLSVITGGPGTGKTTTVAMILSLLLEREPGLKVALAAPTGKAADRLRSSVAQAAERLETYARLPREAATLHRLLGYGPRGFGELGLLGYDVVVVDEASMVSLPLMQRLVASLRPESRLILLGDKDQLASVEAGYVLGDICDAAFGATVGGLRECVVELRRTWRFDSGSAIGELSRAVNAGASEQAVAVALSGSADLSLYPELPPDFDERLQTWYAACLSEADWHRRFELLGRYRVLCAFNHGPRGTAGFNARIERSLALKGLIRPERGPQYHGRPIMVTCNDYGLGLYNGDIGLVMRDQDGALAAWFPTPDGARRLSLTRLPAHETVFAMTVHKSQGSEFDEVSLVLPTLDTELLSRELIYTGLTRARQRLEIIGSPDILQRAVSRRVRRASGLAEALLDA